MINSNDKIEIVKKLISENKSFSFILKTKKYKALHEEIIKYTSTLDISFKERIYWFVNQLVDYPICALPECNCKSTKFLTFEKGYKKYCSAKCAALSEECKQKHIDTCREKYGVDNVAQDINVKAKMQNTVFERYGVTNIGSSEKHREKVKMTNLKKYGTANGHKKEDMLAIGNNISIARCTNFYNRVLCADDEVKPLFSVDEYIESKKDDYLKWHCNNCGKDFISKLKFGDHVARCLNCHPYSESRPEQDIIDFIKEICPNVLIRQHDRQLLKPLEVDIFIPEKKIAIEFDGLYWHSDNILENKNYHLFKTLECERQGIQLIHVFENEWMYKKDIVKSRLKNILGIHDRIIYARKCTVKEVDIKTSRDFQNANHIQGTVNAKVHIGLYFNDELISLMTFGKCRFDKNHEWEMLRFCNKLGCHIPGAAGRLLKHFESTYQSKSIVSYADRRWSNGKLYNALGFKLVHASKPDYWYFNMHDFTLQSRLKYQKHKLKNILKNFDENKTEIENMYMNKFYRIFDCGNLVFEKCLI